MLPLQVIVVGKLGEPWMKAACGEYLKRLRGLATVTEIPEQRLSSHPSPAEIQKALAKEAEQIRNKLSPRAFTVALCIEGKGMTSPQLADVLEQAAQFHPEAAFLIGSSHGLDPALKEEVKRKLSFSPMTFPHQLARIMLLEQLYRANSIQGGGKYHK